MNALRGTFEIPLPDGTQVTCLMNLYALHQFCEETQTKMTDIDKALQENMLANLPKLTWAGVRTHHALREEEPPMTYQRYAILLGSTDWAPIADNVGKALQLDNAGQKKATAKSK